MLGSVHDAEAVPEQPMDARRLAGTFERFALADRLD
jgi:hypothetical protein